MADTFSRSWEQLYQEAVNEPDINNLTQRVHVAEAAMFYRWQELAEISAHPSTRSTNAFRRPRRDC